MENNGRNVMEMGKGLSTVPKGLLVALSVTVAMALTGGMIGFVQFLLTAHVLPVVLVLVGVATITFGTYTLLNHFASRDGGS